MRHTPEELRELTELWARLERLKSGIGGWVLTAATLPATRREAIQADDRIRQATEEGIRVKCRIEELQTPERSAPDEREDAAS